MQQLPKFKVTVYTVQGEHLLLLYNSRQCIGSIKLHVPVPPTNQAFEEVARLETSICVYLNESSQMVCMEVSCMSSTQRQVLRNKE